jgi:hypothetical protein
MKLDDMYDPMVNSPSTTLSNPIGAADTAIEVNDGAVLPTAPNLAVIGTDKDAETVMYTTKIRLSETAGHETKYTWVLQNVTRRFQGVAKVWAAGTPVARNFTAYDQTSMQRNIVALNNKKFENAGDGLSQHEDTVYLPDIVTPGTYIKITVDAKGRVTGATAIAAADLPNIPWTQVSSKPSSLSDYGITVAAADLPNIPWTQVSDKPTTFAGYGLTIATADLPNVGTAGTYIKNTVDAKGRVTGSETLAAADLPNIPWSQVSSKPTTLSGYGITDASAITSGTMRVYLCLKTVPLWICLCQTG